MALYRKTYLCACEGQQEELYLKHLASLIKVYPQRVVTYNTIIGNAFRLEKTYEEYDKAALFDFDFNEVDFKRNLEVCEKLSKNCKRNKQKSGERIFSAYSNVNFDLWLILHKEDYNKPVTSNNAYVADVRRIYGLNSTDNIKSEGVIKKILAQISLRDVKSAIARAENIKKGKIEVDRIVCGSMVYYPNPDFSLHEFLKTVLADCGEA